MKRRTFLTGLLWSATASAHSYKSGDVAIGHAWALPSQNPEGQVFFPMVNNGKAREELVAARSDICALIEMRQNARYDDPPLKSFILEQAMPIPMRPSARHLRLIGLKKSLVNGDKFILILDFLNSGETEIEVHVAEGPSE
jgi:periplasmic copper chaperone A